MLKLNLNLKIFSDPKALKHEWMKAGMEFISYLYCGKVVESLSHLRYTIFSQKIDPPKINTLPPTNESAAEHIKRARITVLLWRSADKIAPPASTANISLYGWKIENDIPVPDYGKIEIAPKCILKQAACKCKALSPCSRGKCSCQSHGLPCTPYCWCKGGEICGNNISKQSFTLDSDEEDEEEMCDNPFED